MSADALASPLFLLPAWAAGLSACTGLVALWPVGRSGFLRLGSLTAALIGLTTVFLPDTRLAAIGVVATVAAALVARRRRLVAPILALAAAVFLWAASILNGPLSALTAALALGGVTSEMLLGHWYLVDPTLPRWALRRLVVIAGVGVAGDALLALVTAPPEASGTLVLAGLAATGLLLLVGVWFSLGHPAYSGVMAATGLSYLAVLTTLGAVFVSTSVTAGRSIGPG